MCIRSLVYYGSLVILQVVLTICLSSGTFERFLIRELLKFKNFFF